MPQRVSALALKAQLKIIIAALYLSHLWQVATTFWSGGSSQYYARAGREPELVVSSQLPEDVIFDILVGLPVKSLIRFRSVCKPWRCIIDSSSFINQHLLHPDHRNSNGSLIVSGYLNGFDRGCYLLSGRQFEKSVCLDPSTDFSLGLDPVLEVVSSCNGIILVVNIRESLKLHAALWNPATKQARHLPEVGLCSRKQNPARFKLALGFGYGVKADDYKVVKISQYLDKYGVEVYRLETDSWRSVDADLLAGSRIYNHSKVYWKGHCCWLSYDPYSILSFDLSGEVFKTISLPDVLSNPHLTLMGDFIACIEGSFGEDGDIYIWVMKEYGVKESWTKLYTISASVYTEVSWNERQVRRYLKPEGFSNNQGFLLFTELCRSRCPFLLFDTNTQERKCLPIMCEDVAVYKESLISVRNSFVK